MPDRDVKGAPETYDCCISIGALIAGGISLAFQGIISGVAVMGAVRKGCRRKETRGLVDGVVVIEGEKEGCEEEREALLSL